MSDRLAPLDVPYEQQDGASNSQGTVARSAAAQLRPDGVFAHKQDHSTYVACFCEDGDLLSQWRGYASGVGYAIGLRRSEIAAAPPFQTRASVMAEDGITVLRTVPGPTFPVDLVRVAYGPKAIRDATERVLQTIAPDPVGHPGSKGWGRAAQVVLPALASIKHEAFIEEREWRLVTVGSVGLDSVQFRDGTLGLVPYVAIPIPTDAIAEIVLGPGPEPHVRERGVVRLLESLRLTEGQVEIRHSGAPFRG